MGERHFGFKSLKTRLKLDMEEKRIVLPELSRTAAELPAKQSHGKLTN